ncbi:MAG: thiamine phosphate synthase [Clostridia bacterium]|nr:thiamine phosphate synthase [Clostridia bacterium]
MKIHAEQLRLYAVTDGRWAGEKGLALQVKEALCGGATCVQLREKDMPDGAFLKEALEIKEICRAYNVKLLINDRVELALKIGADGVHVGQDDAKAADVRKMIGDKMILGVTAHNLKEASDAERAGADYLGVGAAFSTGTKTNARVIPHAVYSEICRVVKIPVVAIGGINENNIKELKGAGLAGVAVVSAIFASSNIKESCERLLRLSNEVCEK